MSPRDAEAPAPAPVPPLDRHPPAGPVRETLVFAGRAVRKLRHNPEQLFDVIVSPIMFTVMFTYLFGGALAGSPQDYLQFLLPGILVQTVMFTSVYTGFTLNQDISKGVFDRFRALPIWRPAPIAGAIAGDVLRYTASALIVLAVGMGIGYRPEAGPAAVLAALALLNLFAFGIGWVFTALALLVRTPGTVMTLSWMVLMPLTFASNIYVDPATMPGWLQAFVAVNPVALIVTALRGVLGAMPDAVDIGLALVAPALIVAVFGPLTMRLYARER
ncbi:MAG: ABC transporter permease [Rhodospirillales bacterium]|nr:MAG: ABC transporter permease [Rhodospirillales bacterium]